LPITNRKVFIQDRAVELPLMLASTLFDKKMFLNEKADVHPNAALKRTIYLQRRWAGGGRMWADADPGER
jgi:hypothetical protein